MDNPVREFRRADVRGEIKGSGVANSSAVERLSVDKPGVDDRANGQRQPRLHRAAVVLQRTEFRIQWRGKRAGEIILSLDRNGALVSDANEVVVADEN